MLGSTELLGAIPAITAVAAEVADALPWLFVAVTTTRTVPAMSASTSWYVLDVAPTMSPHPLPLLSHRRHWYAYVGVGVPLHVPVVAVSV